VITNLSAGSRATATGAGRPSPLPPAGARLAHAKSRTASRRARAVLPARPRHRCALSPPTRTTRRAVVAVRFPDAGAARTATTSGRLPRADRGARRQSPRRCAARPVRTYILRRPRTRSPGSAAKTQLVARVSMTVAQLALTSRPGSLPLRLPPPQSGPAASPSSTIAILDALLHAAPGLAAIRGWWVVRSARRGTPAAPPRVPARDDGRGSPTAGDPGVSHFRRDARVISEAGSRGARQLSRSPASAVGRPI